MNAKRDIGALLVQQFDVIQDDLDARGWPYKQAAEYRRRVEIAEAFVADQDCECVTPDDECRWHYLAKILAGDA